MNADEIIKKTFYDPQIGLQSADKLYYKLKSKGITKKQITEFLKKQEVQQVHKNVKPIKKFFPIYAEHKNEIWQTDLLDLSNLSRYNQGYRYILIFIDVHSRFVYAIPLKNKISSTVNKEIKDVLLNEKPELIQADRGSEFINNAFKKILSDNNIQIQFLQTSHQLGIINRFCRTIRNLIEKYMTAYHTNNYISVFDKIIKNYNTSYHKGIQSTPSNPDESTISKLNLEKLLDAKNEESTFEIDDTVRFIKNRKAFEKGTLPHFSSTLHNVINKNVHSYELDNGKWFMYYELQKVKSSETLPIETPKETRDKIRKENARARILSREDIQLQNVINQPRTSKRSIRLQTDVVLPIGKKNK